jgi:hypothetical protein
VSGELSTPSLPIAVAVTIIYATTSEEKETSVAMNEKRCDVLLESFEQWD